MKKLFYCSVSFACLFNFSLLANAVPADGEYHYEPVPGKVVGIWPDAWTVERMSHLRTQYGFSGVFLSADMERYTNALQSGFSSSSIMVGTGYDSYMYAVNNMPAGTYYIDEPAEHDCYGHPTGARLYTPQEFAAIRDYVHTNRPGAIFVIGGYKRCSHNQIAATYADLIMYSSYKNWDQFGLPVCHVNIGWGNEWENPWLPGSDDQRNSWTSMRQTFGTKYAITWIHGGGDEYADLFAHANALGLTGIWQYNGAPIDSARLESFCYAAWQNGWLARVPNTPLPVQLASFTARYVSHDRVLLRWLTLSELNNYGFEIQRRAPTESQFETLPNSFVPGNGTSVEPHEYEFADSNASGGPWFYRLKQIDLDGAVHFSEEIQANLLTGVSENGLPVGLSLLQNYPNPFNPFTTIEFDIPTAGLIRLTITNLLGQEVAKPVDGFQSSGKYRVMFDASGLASGVYTYKLATPMGGLHRKMLFLK